MLGDDTAAYLPELRAHAESRMTSIATVWRKSSPGDPQDESTGYESPAWVREHVDIRCRIGSDKGSSATRLVSTPGGDVQLAVRTFHCPAATDNLVDGDYVEITAGEIAGSVWRIVEADFADQQTARRCPVVAVDRPEEWI